jgi:hypothetical protein
VPRRVGVVVATAVAILWFVVGVAVLGSMMVDALTMSDDQCRLDQLGQDGEISWQAWPPGTTCTSPLGVEYREPSALRGWLLVVEAVVGVGLVVAWRVLRNAPEPDWQA